MKFCNVHCIAYHLRCIKGKTNTFFYMPFLPEAVVSETMIVFVYYFLHALYHVPCILHFWWHRERERVPKQAQDTESRGFRVEMDWETIWPQLFLKLLQPVYSLPLWYSFFKMIKQSIPSLNYYCKMFWIGDRF